MSQSGHGYEEYTDAYCNVEMEGNVALYQFPTIAYTHWSQRISLSLAVVMLAVMAYHHVFLVRLFTWLGALFGASFTWLSAFVRAAVAYIFVVMVVYGYVCLHSFQL